MLAVVISYSHLVLSRGRRKLLDLQLDNALVERERHTLGNPGGWGRENTALTSVTLVPDPFERERTSGTPTHPRSV
jgi:hypothetical protein